MSMSEVIGRDFLADETNLRNMLIFSAVLHLVTLALLLLLPGFQFGPRINPFPEYSVTLVSPGELSGAKPSLAANHLEKAKQRIVAKEPTRIQKTLEVKKLEPAKIVPEKSVVPKNVLPSPEKKPEKQKEETAKQASQGDAHLQEAIDRIRGEFGRQAATNAAGAVGVRGGTGTTQIPEMVVYTSIVIDRIMESWFLPPSLQQEASSRNLLTIIDIRIDREGKVSFQGVEQRSGNALYDEYALAAIKKVQALSFPPLPEVFREPHLDLGIRFQPTEASFS